MDSESVESKRECGAVIIDQLFRARQQPGSPLTPVKRWMMPPEARAVLRCLAGHRNPDTGRCDPGAATIADETGFSVSTVKKAIRELAARGWVTVERRRVGELNDSNQYTLHITPGDMGRWWPKPAKEAAEAIPESVPTPETMREAVAPVIPTPPPSTPKPEPEATTPEKPMTTFALTAPTTLKPARRKPAKLVPVPMPADWKPSAANEAFAKERGIDLGIEVHSFTEHYRGSEQPSWNGRFATWLANAAKWTIRDAKRPGVSRANVCQPSGAALSIAEF